MAGDDMKLSYGLLQSANKTPRKSDRCKFVCFCLYSATYKHSSKKLRTQRVHNVWFRHYITEVDSFFLMKLKCIR